MKTLAIIALCALAGPARAEDATPVEVSGGLAPTAEVTGSAGIVRLFGALAPSADVGYRPAAVERDRWAYGAAGSRASLGLFAAAGDVSGLVFMLVGAPADGQSSVVLDRAIVRWNPIEHLVISAGRDLVPVSAQTATPTAALLFPSRVPLTDTFVLDAQAGAQIAGVHDLGTVQVGVWNGVASDVMAATPTDERGLLMSARLEATPLGSFGFDENGGRGPLRVGIGVGATYRAASTFLPDGQAATRSRDLRAAASVRVGWQGLLVEGELLRRQITDDLSMRPDVATGGYLQGSWRLHVGDAQLAPLLRVGVLAIRQLSAPARGHSIEAGLAAFATRSERLRVVALYQQLQDPDLGSSYRGLVQLRLAF